MKKPEPTSLDLQEEEGTGEETFLKRWSRRKLEDETVNTPPEVEMLQPEPQLATDVPEEAQPLVTTDLDPTDEDMPPLEALDENSDYSGFLSPKVSESLRRQALRKLFHLPQFNITDGLNDYDDDYTQHEKLGSVVTHEMKRLLKREAEKQQAGSDADSQHPDELRRPTDMERADPVESAETFESENTNNPKDTIEANNATNEAIAFKDTTTANSQEDYVNAEQIDRNNTET